jgi:hypothetical protein
VTRISRREFVAIAAAGAAAAVRPRDATAAGITAEQIIERIKSSVGVPWNPETVDTLKAGSPATVVNGIVTTSAPTLEALRQAVKAGANLVITSGTTFYSRADTPMPPAGRGAQAPASDPVFAAKGDFLRNNNLVVWRFSDHWRLRKPDPFAEGLIDALGWSGSARTDDGGRVSIAETTLESLASGISRRLNARGGIRVVGDPRLRVRTVGVLPGVTPVQASLRELPAVDVLVAGEVREWESVEYARDVVSAGGRKGLILVGRVLSEGPGMRVCAQWLGTIVPELTTTWISTGDCYWRPV